MLLTLPPDLGIKAWDAFKTLWGWMFALLTTGGGAAVILKKMLDKRKARRIAAEELPDRREEEVLHNHHTESHLWRVVNKLQRQVNAQARELIRAEKKKDKCAETLGDFKASLAEARSTITSHMFTIRRLEKRVVKLETQVGRYKQKLKKAA